MERGNVYVGVTLRDLNLPYNRQAIGKCIQFEYSEIVAF